ncbi:MAG TPA: hypothetical protein VML55_08075 [Planctomycetaceae bacterium]|nr:hypothetical protein [Planctomycetaceae bacterium]
MTDLRRLIPRFLADLEAAQSSLQALLAEKRRALTAADAAELERIGPLEAERVRELQVLLARRRRILEQAAAAGLSVESLAELVDRLGGGERAALQQQIERLRAGSEAVRRETWIHWTVAHSISSHYSELLELIANCGREAPTYEERPAASGPGGGAILDASV